MKKSNDHENLPEYSISYRLRVIQGLLKIRSVAAFANEIGVDTSVLNNIMSPSGRKGKPSFDTLQKIAVKYPRVNVDWLVTGKGDPLRPFNSSLLETKSKTAAESGNENSNCFNKEQNIPELISLLKVCQAEKESLERILALKDELIEVLRNKK